MILEFKYIIYPQNQEVRINKAIKATSVKNAKRKKKTKE